MRRRAGRANLIGFTEYTHSAYEAAAHHRLIADKLDAVARGEIDRLMINTPPRHGKTELASRRYPARLLATTAGLTVMSAAYNWDRAQEVGGEVLDVVRSAEFQTLYPGVTLKEDTRAKGFWRTNSGGYYVAAGIGTSLTGRGTPHPVVIIDDPHKDREEADSETQRGKVKNWYSSVVLSRFPRAIIIVQTRWHEDDLSGWLLSKEEEQWNVLCLPAINAGGEALWPEKYPLPVLERLRASTIPRDWSALYQQNPTPDEGLFLDVGKIQRVKPPPLSDMRIFAASDYATKDGSGDHTVHGIGGLDADDNLHILEVWRKQTTTDVWIDQMKSMVRSWQPLQWGEEGGVIIRAVSPQIDRVLGEEPRAYVSRVQYPAIADKPTRARPLQGRIAQGKLCVSPDAYWADEYIAELARFPAATFDDQVDMTALLAVVAATLGPPRKPKPATGGAAGGSFWSS